MTGEPRQLHSATDYAAQWDDSPLEQEIELPSGRKVVVQEPDLPMLAKQGIIPNHLLPVVEKFIMEGVNHATTGLGTPPEPAPDVSQETPAPVDGDDELPSIKASRTRVGGANAKPQAKGLQPGDRIVKYADFLQYVDVYAVAALVKPKLSFDGKGGTVHVKRLSAADKLHVWEWGAGIVRAVAAFPGDGDGAVATGGTPPDGGEVRDEAERPAGVDE